MSFWQRLCCQEEAASTPQKPTLPLLLAQKRKCEPVTIQQTPKRSRQGVFTYTNGDQYEGQWLNDKRHGRGKMLYINGDFFMGEWVEDRREGRGLHVFQDMSKYEGQWKGDLIDGIGKLIEADGSCYEGEFTKGEKDGKGCYYSSQNKKKYISKYKEGQLISCDPIQMDSSKEQSDSPHRQVITIHIDQPKVTDEDIKIYENNNPEIKDLDCEQLLAYLGIVKIRQLPFIKTLPRMWKLEHVKQWLKVIGLEVCQPDFEANKVVGSGLLELTEDDMRHDLKMKLGHRRRLLRALTILKKLHNPKLKKEKRTLKHLKNYKKSSAGSSISPPAVKPPNFKTPNSMTKFIPSLNNDPIVEENAENEDHDDSPSMNQRRFMNSPKKLEKEYEPETVHELNFATEQWNSYNTLTAGNRQDTHKYESLNINDHVHSQRDSTQKREEIEYEEKEQRREQEFLDQLDHHPVARKQASKRPKKKEEEDIDILDHAVTMRKQQSKKVKGTQQNHLHDALAAQQQNKKLDEQESSSSSGSDNQTEGRVHKRKKSRDERPMEMRELYEYLKDHHISMNFLIPENQITNMEQIGQGGYGKVYKAKWMSNPVAVKTYLKAGRIHRQSLDDFLKEVEILNNLRHPNVVLYMGMCIQINRYSLVTEYLEEGSLFDQLHKKHTILSTDRIFEIVEDIVMGMVYLHAKNILHRDLKSSNVLIGDDWKVKLCDFGLSEMHSKKKMKVGRARIGTYQWMAPEVLRKEKNIGFSADVYSFGMVLWELLTHKIPFEDFMPAQIEGLVGWDESFRVPTPTQGDPFLIQIMEKCLEKKPYQRPLFLQILDMLKEHQEKKKQKSVSTTAVVPYSDGEETRMA